MRIGTDAVLLGAWASVNPGPTRIADIGTGCGIIALMLAQRAPGAEVDAVEISPEACLDARTNFGNSPWKERLHLLQCSFEAIDISYKYDLVVSNPPFFKETLRSPDAARAEARHEGVLCFASLAESCARWMADDGRLAVILPASQDEETVATAALNRLHPMRRCHVRNRAASTPVRTLWEFSRISGPCQEEEIVLRNNDGIYSEPYCRLTADFHIFLKK